MILFKNCRLIKELTEGYEGEYADILINDEDIIERISSPGTIRSEGARIVDAKNNTVLPGFFELHAHLCLSDMNFHKLRTTTQSENALEALSFAREYLKQGYTTIRDAGTIHNVTVELKRAKERGIVNIPDIISSGQIITPTENGNDTFANMYYEVDSPYEVRKGCRKQFELGNDIIKCMLTGAYLNEGGNPGETIMMEDEVREAVKVAKMKGSYVMGHAHGAEGIQLGIRCGVGTIEHGSFIDDETIQILKESDECFLVPTAAIGLACFYDAESLSEDMMDKRKRYELAEKEALNKAYRAGLKLGFGSDIDKENFVKYPGMEFYARTDWYDFEYKDILIQATKNSAEIAGLSEKKGTIKVGKKGELVVIEGKPDEDIYKMKKMPLYVYFNGELIEN
ncbi:MAG: amidohydrolase family protein [Clostridiales bacterium]|nr:amidohydrolase family protein [Clostridiales bacterium]